MKIRDVFAKSKNLRVNSRGEIVKVNKRRKAFAETYPIFYREEVVARLNRK